MLPPGNVVSIDSCVVDTHSNLVVGPFREAHPLLTSLVHCTNPLLCLPCPLVLFLFAVARMALSSATLLSFLLTLGRRL